MTVIGGLALWAALALAIWGTAAGIIAARGAGARADDLAESAERALAATAVLASLAAAGLAAALLRPDYTLAFVVGTTTYNLPSAYRLAALLSRPAGSLIGLAAFAAAFGCVAISRVRRAVGDHAPVLSTLLNGAVLATLVIAVAAVPYAPAVSQVADGMGLDPAWQIAATPIARLALLFAAALGVVAAARTAAGMPSRHWSLAAWGAGSAALLFALRRSLAGPPWAAIEWIALGLWLAIAVVEYRRAGASRVVAALALAGGAASILALAGTALRVERFLPLASSESLEVGGPLGSRWRITSEGLSSYEELNRLVTAVLVDVRRSRRSTRIARAEWRQYLDSRGNIIAQDIPVAGVVNGGINTVVVALAEEPRLDGATFRVRFIPLFGLWWMAAACFIAAAAAAAAGATAREEDAP